MNGSVDCMHICFPQILSAMRLGCLVLKSATLLLLGKMFLGNPKDRLRNCDKFKQV